MNIQNNNQKIKSKAIINNKTKKRGLKKKRRKKNIEKTNTNQLLFIIFLTGILLIFSSYAWLSQSLNVKVKFFDLSVSTDNGLFISLDGIDFSDTVEISLDSVITDLKARYSNHTNQWATNGLWPVSTNGIKTPNMDKFEVYAGEVSKRYRSKNNRRFLNTVLINENEPNSTGTYIAFDLFLKNVSGSPKPDNLYFGEETFIDFSEDTSEETRAALGGVMNSMRVGIVKMGSVTSKSDVRTIQNIKCNNNCEMFIYEPNSTDHSNKSIEKVQEYGVTLVNGVYMPTYAVISEGVMLEHANGQVGSNIPLDIAHFALQRTLKKEEFRNPLFKIPNGITKLRIYVWIEGQDMDSLEETSEGAAINIGINFIKDLAGYE